MVALFYLTRTPQSFLGICTLNYSPLPFHTPTSIDTGHDISHNYKDESTIYYVSTSDARKKRANNSTDTQYGKQYLPIESHRRIECTRWPECRAKKRQTPLYRPFNVNGRRMRGEYQIWRGHERRQSQNQKQNISGNCLPNGNGPDSATYEWQAICQCECARARKDLCMRNVCFSDL